MSNISTYNLQNFTATMTNNNKSKLDNNVVIIILSIFIILLAFIIIFVAVYSLRAKSKRRQHREKKERKKEKGKLSKEVETLEDNMNSAKLISEKSEKGENKIWFTPADYPSMDERPSGGPSYVLGTVSNQSLNNSYGNRKKVS